MFSRHASEGLHGSTIGHGSHSVRFTIAGNAVAAQVDAMSESFRRTWAGKNLRDGVVDVPCAPLSSLMASAGLHSATFLSLDVEGAEALVLETVDAAAFTVVLVEMDGHSPTKDARVHQRLVAAGHRHLHELTILHSRVYMRRGVIDDKWLHRWLSSLPPSSPPPPQ